MHPRQSLIHLGVLIRLVAGAMFLFIDSDSDWFAECGWLVGYPIIVKTKASNGMAPF
jgi:hypothetical protein